MLLLIHQNYFPMEKCSFWRRKALLKTFQFWTTYILACTVLMPLPFSILPPQRPQLQIHSRELLKNWEFHSKWGLKIFSLSSCAASALSNLRRLYFSCLFTTHFRACMCAMVHCSFLPSSTTVLCCLHIIRYCVYFKKRGNTAASSLNVWVSSQQSLCLSLVLEIPSSSQDIFQCRRFEIS